MRLDQAHILKPPTGRGVVAVTADEAGRYTRFAISMQGLQIPDGSRTLWLVGNDIPGNRNVACQSLIDGDGDWVWFIDDDHAFKPDLLARLLARNVDIVTPLCLRRVQPFLPIPCVDEGFIELNLYGPNELVEVQHAGSSGMLIKRHVLERIEPPWFHLSDGVSEDVNFCIKAKQAGLDIHVDLGSRLGHITTAVIWPAWDADNDRWLNGFTVADGAQLATPLTPLPKSVA